MKIFIPTIHRSDKIQTLDSLLVDGKIPYEIHLVTSEAEYGSYQKYHSQVPFIHYCPNHFHIAETRQWIIDFCAKQEDPLVLMMDDDLRFFKRPDLEDPALRKLEEGETAEMLIDLNNLFGEYLHISMSARMGNNRFSGNRIRECNRPYRIYGFDAKVLKEEGVGFKPAGIDFPFTMDDFHVTLSLLELGYNNAILWSYVHDQLISNAEGGASTYRSLETQSKSARALAAAHPNFVKVVEKTTSDSWNGATREDVIIQWKKAYCSREAERKLFR